MLPSHIKTGRSSKRGLRKTDMNLVSYKTQRLPRSADPSPQRTVERIESLGEKHGVKSNPDFNFEHFQSRMAFHRRTGSIPSIPIHEESGYAIEGNGTSSENSNSKPHHHHQVLYVCRGHCSGPQCDFSKSLKQWHSTVWLNDGSASFQSQVVASAPKALEKLDQKRETLRSLKGVLAAKLEKKAKNREAKLMAKSEKRSASAMNMLTNIGRPDSRIFTPQQERSASAMTVLKQPQTPNSETTKSAREAARQQRRRNHSTASSKKEELKTKLPMGNIWDLSAQDLLAKSHEELVLLLIHLRRQGATLSEAIDGSRAELENITNTIVTSSDDKDSVDNKRILDDLHLHVKELEERRAKIQPIINLVDNMVKLGSLYRGPSDAPLSHRIRNLPSSNATNNNSTISQELKDEIQELIQKAKDVRQNIGQHIEKVPEHQEFLEKDLHRAQNKLRDSEKQIEEIGSQQSKWEHEMLILRQQLQNSATKDMKFGIHQSVETLHIEAELAHVQQKAAKLATKRYELVNEMQRWTPSSNSSDNNSENRPKTVRMVKRDSKDRVKSPNENPPNLLPRGKNSNNHDFLIDDSSPTKSSTLPRSFRSEDLKDLKNNGPIYSGVVKPSMIHGYKRREDRPGSSLSAHERLFGPTSSSQASPPDSKKASPIMSPIFKSDTARAIAKEVGLGDFKKSVKKRSLTISGSNPASVQEALNNHKSRACDDLDMEQALKTDGLCTPDVIKSALDHKSEGSKISETTIDSLFGVPDKIVIPERYIPDTDMDNLTPEERQVRLKKADSIRRMLAEQSTTGKRNAGDGENSEEHNEEKKQREHLLALNQVIARQVMEKSRMVAGKKKSRPHQ